MHQISFFIFFDDIRDVINGRPPDDVWVTGYLAQQLGIQHLDIMQLWTQDRDRLLMHKVDIGNTGWTKKGGSE